LKINKEIQILADSGSPGIKKLHKNSKIPHKKTKKKPLTEEQKRYNKTLSKQRIFIENIIRSLKIFRVLSSKYRSRRKRFHLRFNLIAGIYN
jgi:hypothetical protein